MEAHMKKIAILTSAVLLGTFALSACQDRDDLASDEQNQVATEGAPAPADPYAPPATQMPGAVNESLGTTGPAEPGDAPPPGAPPEPAY
jgi:hypothetical protein